MFQFMTARQAVDLIEDGDLIGLNTFLALSSAFALHDALMERFAQTGHPRDLSIYAPCGFGDWDERHNADQYCVAGAVKRVMTSHFPSIPGVEKMARENRIEAYNMPLGVMSKCVRAAAAGQKWHLTKVGLNLFVDPTLDGPAVNAVSHEEWVRRVNVAGEDFLYYKTPEVDVALIRGTSVDPAGNICCAGECVTVDALALAQLTHARGGKVIVQVERVSSTFERPRNVILPGILVDVVVVCDRPSFESGLSALSGDIHVPNTHMDYWVGRISSESTRSVDDVHRAIGRRAVRELKPGQVVNIGVGYPEMVGRCAAKTGILRDIVLTVESGGIGGLPAPGHYFGATIGADCIVDMAQQFDFYNGGGLDICFMGALEVDRRGNVNAHRVPGGKFVGIGGFADITFAAKTVVFCMSFTAKGLEISQDEEGAVRILSEGERKKFKPEIAAISFSAANALARGQRVLYVTERCVFELTPDGLRLAETAPGIDAQRDIMPLLDFDLAP